MAKYKKIRYGIRLILLTLILYSISGSLWNLSAENSGLKVLKQNSEEVVVIYSVPSFKIEKNLINNNEIFNTVEIPGTVQSKVAGYPEIPIKSFLIGIPEDTNVEIDILETKSIKVGEIKLLSSPKNNFLFENGEIKIVQEYETEKTVENDNVIYPDNIVKVNNTAYLRDQKVARIALYPVQYTGTKDEIKIFKLIKFRIRFQRKMFGSSRKTNPKSNCSNLKSSFFDDIKKNLILNFSSLIPLNNAPSNIFRKSSSLTSSSEIPRVKITTKLPGIYKINYTNLKNSGLNPASIIPENLKLFNNSEEVSIFIYGEDDGSFDKDDYILFYGEEVDSEYTAFNSYMLSISDTAGFRMKEQDANPDESSLKETEFKNKIKVERDLEYTSYVIANNPVDHWYWSRMNGGDRENYIFEINNPVISTTVCTMTITFQGRSYNNSMTPDHHVKISINNYLLGDVYFDGQETHKETLSFPQTYLYDGDNVLYVEAPGDTGSGSDSFYFEGVELEFKEKLIVVNDILKFYTSTTGKNSYEISGFSNDDIWGFNISDGKSPQIISGTNKVAYEGKYKAIIASGSEEGESIYLLSSNKIKVPKKVEMLDDMPDLKSEFNEAEYLMITHDDFYDALKPLVRFRRNQGLRTKEIKVSDIYNQFGEGISGPSAIKAFLQYAYEYWSIVPSYVLLVGDDNNDYKNNLKTGRKSFVPTKIIKLSQFPMAVPSDNWFVELNGDDALPEMIIGRITANSVEQVKDAIHKIKKYEKISETTEWTNRVAFIADDKLPEFETISEMLAKNYVPGDFNIERIYLSKYKDTSAVTEDIIKSVSKGNLITVFTGHGNVNNWTEEPALETSDVDSFENKFNLPLLVTLDCNNGYFVRPQEEFSLGEKFVMSRKNGAIATFTSTGVGISSEHALLSEELFSLIFKDKKNVLGDVATEAKISAYSWGASEDLVRTFILFGDPALGLKVDSKKIDILNPLNGRSIQVSKNGYGTVSWKGLEGFKYKVKFSNNESFDGEDIYKIPQKGWIKTNYKKIKPEKVDIINNFIKDNNETLFFRVKGKKGIGATKDIVFSPIRKIR